MVGIGVAVTPRLESGCQAAAVSGSSLTKQAQRHCHVARRSKGLHMEKVKIEHHSVSGSLWFGGWLFTIGFLQLTFWKAVVAIVVWPYFLGLSYSGVAH
jgi:hypothetical protein